MRQGKEALEADLNSGRFLSGSARGRWRSVRLDWPLAIIEVKARDGRWFCVRLDCTGYPDQAPTGTLWDLVNGTQLPAHLWPQGGRVSQALNPGWKGGAALYLPCDRESIVGHDQWRTDHPYLIWDPNRGVLQYIEAVHELLHSHELIAKAA